MKNFCRFFFFIAVWASLGRSEAQTIAASEPLALRNDHSYELIGRLKDKILLFRDRFDKFEVVAFDQRMRIDWERDLEFEGRAAQTLSLQSSKTDFSALVKARRKNELFVKLYKFDPEAALIDSATVKAWKINPFSSPRLQTVVSENRNCIALLDMADSKSLEATVFQIDKMKIIWQKTVALETDYFDDSLVDWALSDVGELALVSEKNNKRSLAEEHHFKIRLLSAAQERIVEAPFKGYLAYDALFRFDDQNHRLCGAGLYGERNAERADGHFFIAVPPSGERAEPVLEPFGEHFLSILKGKEVEEGSKGITDIDVRQLIFRRDGGAAIVCERNHEITRGMGSGRTSGFGGPRLVIDYYYDDFFVISIGPEGKADWKTILHKKQYSQDDEAVFSSFLMLKTPDRLRFFFNDEIRFESTCSEYIVGAEGGFDRNSLLSTVDQNLRLRFRDGIQLSANEALVPSEWRSKLRLVLIRI